MRLNIRLFSLLSMLIFFGLPAWPQLIQTDPAFPRANDSVVIYFNSAEGSGGLKNYMGDVYAHTGVITQNSTSGSDWKYVKTNWGQNTPATRLVRISANLYKLTITPNIRAYYGVPANEKILQMAFVFRSDLPVNNGGYFEGKTAAGGDIYVDVYESGLQIKLNKPSGGHAILNPGDTLDVLLQAQDADSLFIQVNQVTQAAGTGDSLSLSWEVPGAGKFWIKGIAKDATSQVADSFYVFIRPPVITQALPAGIREGINITGPHSVVLCLYAPLKQHAFAIGDFSNWELDTSYYMRRTPDLNHFWVELNGLDADKPYIFQYLVDGEIRIGDPYCERVSDPWNDSYITAATYPGMIAYPSGKTQGIASVFRINEETYQWKATNFTAPPPEKLVVYELLIRDFTDKHSFQAVIDSLNYLLKLGINAVELMPVNEFEGNSSWGYNPNYYFAVDKYYGRKNDFKRLVDTLHHHGIAVILDVVYNHSFGTAPYVMLYWDKAQSRPSANSPFYNMTPRHDFNVGFDFNHESQATKKLIGRALKFWLEEFRVDGYRFDLSKGFTQKQTLGNVSAWGQYDANRIKILSDYADTVWSVNPNAYVILEHFADNPEEIELSSRGMLLWGNANHAYAEAAMGYHTGGKSDFSYVSHRQRGWSKPHLIGYMESHDEERIMYKALQWGNAGPSYAIKQEAVALERMKLITAFFLTIPGPKMIWQFGEYGYDYSIDYNGRTGEKPVRWDYLNIPGRKDLYRFYGALNALRMQNEAFNTEDFDLDVAGNVKRILLMHSSMNVVVIGNFDVSQQLARPRFPHTGWWYDYFSGDSLQVADTSMLIPLAPGAFHLFTSKKRPKPQDLANAWPLLPVFTEGMVHVYPNPSSGDVHIYLDLPFEVPTEVDIRLTDMAGRLVGGFQTTILKRDVVSLKERGIHLGSGVYLCRIAAGGFAETEKLIIR